LLWEKRTLLKKKKEKKMKMIHNGQERLDNGGRIGMFERVKEEKVLARRRAHGSCVQD
jgi:hypothetical protein